MNGIVPVGSTATFKAYAYGQNGTWQDVTTFNNPNDGAYVVWSSSNSQVATSQGGGQFNGVAPGNFVANATASLIDLNADCPEGSHQLCPTSLYTGDAPGQITQAIPVNFTSSPGTPLSQGALFFTYSWSSSSGKVPPSDLSSCTAGESVYYPGYPNSFTWPPPMVNKINPPNPTVISGPASSGGMEDTNYGPDSYQQPYTTAGFPATQRFWWTCPYWKRIILCRTSRSNGMSPRIQTASGDTTLRNPVIRMLIPCRINDMRRN